MAGDTRDGFSSRILKHLNRLGLSSFSLDTVTPGDGSCFMTATLQQVKRHIDSYPTAVKALATSEDQYGLRKAVKTYMNTSKHSVILDWKSRFRNVTGMSWEFYWSSKYMLKTLRGRGQWTWADSEFIQFTAWYLVRDIMIVSDESTLEKIWTRIPGNIEDEETPCEGPPIHLFYITGLHYQSIVEIDEETEEMEHDNEDKQECPACGKKLKQILRHISKSPSCIEAIGKQNYEEMKIRIRKESGNKKNQKYRKRKRAEDDSEYLGSIKKQVAETRNKQIVKNSVLYHKNLCDQVADWRSSHKGSEDRLKAFLQATLHGPDFVCVSCHQRMFRNNVSEITNKLFEELTNIIGVRDFIEDINLASQVLLTAPEKGGKKSCFICLTCLVYLRKKKLPPVSVKNCLKLHETDQSLAEQDLVLTELEGALIAKRILFQKVILLPRSRWTALKDKQINIPITDKAINNTLIQLPRTPQNAGLIGVQLKRKIEYRGSHQHQLINPEKVFRMIDKLKLSGNSFYQDVHTIDTYRKACQEEDEVDSYQLVFGENKKCEPCLQKVNFEEVGDEILKETMEEEERNDPIKKFQFTYDQSVVMSDKYPEISVAPGEGQSPSNILMDEYWDVQAFPWLHNPDGSNGLNCYRKVKLTPQRYFISRITNLEQRFARSSVYLYAANSYLEQMQINRNINLIGTRGRKIVSEDGQVSYEINDEFKALEGMKNTPKYWQKMKFEFIAKLENLGPFQFFFTLSCADMRWDSCFASVLASRGYTVYSEVIMGEDSHWKTIVRVVDSNGNWKLLDEFLEEEVKSSLHELIRNNVVLATRYFNHRLKTFVRSIIMSRGNPMCAKFYSYKIEFQERGAAHAHGVIWCDFERLEKLERGRDGKLFEPKDNKGTCEKPLDGIANIFKKLRTSQNLSAEEIGCLKTFVDEYITVSTDHQAVGKDVAIIAGEVNRHRHTKTCRKYGDDCRFNYPRFPIPESIIAEVLKNVSKSEKEKILKRNAEVLAKVKVILDDEDAMKDILEKIPKNITESSGNWKKGREDRIKLLLEKAGVDMNEYVKALTTSSIGYAVVFARDVDETFINPYNVDWLRAWNGNLDLQVCLDFHAVITYITDYYSKDDSGTMEVIKSVLKEEQPANAKEKMRTVGNTFLTHRQMGEAEAAFKLIPSMNLSNSNITCQWVSLGTKEERSTRWILADKDQTNSGIPLVKLKDHEGLWCEQQDMVSKYHRRPSELKDMCLAHFAKMYRSSRESNQDENDIAGNDATEDDSQQRNVEKFNFVMTFKNNGSRGLKLPSKIKLSQSQPGEVPIMSKRTYPAALRYHKAKKATDVQKYMFGEVMLFYPHSEELDPENVKAMFDETYNGKRKIEIVKSQVMEFLEDVEESRYYAEMANAKLNLESTANKLDGQGEQENGDCIEEGEHENPELEHLDPKHLDLRNPEAGFNLYKKIELPNDAELKRSSRNLDKHQREVLNAVVKLAKDIVKARKIHNKYPKPLYIMVHGGAGSGKSTTIHNATHWTHKILLQEGDNSNHPFVIRAAFCGTAAANIDGQTLHSAFGFSFSKKFFSLSDKQRDIRREILKYLVLIIIDEISMVKSDMLYQLDLRLQEIKEKVGVPFGGVSIIVFGDMMQLRPCQGRYIFEDPSNEEFLTTHQISPRWKMFKSIVLEGNHRQGNDKSYADMLNRIRVGGQTKGDLKVLQSRVRRNGHSDLRSVDMFITGKRKECANINLLYIAKLKGSVLNMKAVHHHQTRKTYKPYISKKDQTVADTGFMDELLLKENCKVILIYNISTVDGLTNGQIGVLQEAIRDQDGKVQKLVVRFRNQSIGKQNRNENPGLARRFPDCCFIDRVSLQYSLRKNATEVSSTATIIQFPLKLAHAITSHKVQGQSVLFPSTVAMDINSTFQDAQSYVILSRVQCLEQVFIVDSLDEKKIRTSDSALKEMDRLDHISLNKNPTPWRKKSSLVKIASLNCAGFIAHYPDILADEFLLSATVLLLQETSLCSEEIYDIPGFPYTHDHQVSRGKGIISYSKEYLEDTVSRDLEDMQLDKISIEDIDIINVYRSAKGNKHELIQALDELICESRVTVIAGDFNICLKRESRNLVTEFLKRKGFCQLVNEATHIAGGLIDHVYINSKECVLSIERYSPYYSDHDANLLTLIPKD